METEKLRLFSPVVDGVGLKPEEYMLKYPELSKRDETRNLRAIELMWCWYYGAPESPFVIEEIKHDDKCIDITKLIFDKINKGRTYDSDKLAKIRSGHIPPDWFRAIDFFKTRSKEIRSRAKDILDTIFDQYEKIVEDGIEGFKTDDGYDYAKFTMTMKKITEEMDELVKKKEEGYGVSKHLGFNDSLTEGDYWNSYYHKTKG